MSLYDNFQIRMLFNPLVARVGDGVGRGRDAIYDVRQKNQAEEVSCCVRYCSRL